MAFGFIGKLAGLLLGKKSQKKEAKTGAAPEAKRSGRNTQERKRSPEGKEGFKRDRNGKPSRWQAPRGAAQPSPVRSAKPSKGKKTAKPAEVRKQAVPATAARRAAKPSDKGGKSRGVERRRGRHENTAAGIKRAGGVFSEEEFAKNRELHAQWDPNSYTVEPQEGKKRFHEFDLPSELMHAIADLGFKYCSPIQALSLDAALAGKNVAGKAQTGTGKTAAYLVAILTRYLRSPEKRAEKGGVPRALVIAPTRELVIQIAKDAEALGKYCGLRCLAIYGGMDYERQREEVLSAPVDLLVATPGRLLDFCRGRTVDLSRVDTLVIDEADRMLDMGFIPDVRSIMHRLPPKEKRATMLYSATLNDDIMNLALQWMEEPVKCEVEGDTVNTEAIKQIVYVVTSDQKFTVLFNHIMQYPDSRTIIFCNRRHTTEAVHEGLRARGVHCEMLSGDVGQNQRLRVLEDFRAGKTRIVVATDVAGRGLHVDDIGFVINFDFPYEPEDYVHRIGRTGRAGATGVAISFADEDESFIIPDIEKYIGEELKCTFIQPEDPLLAQLPDRQKPQRKRKEKKEAPQVQESAPEKTEVKAEEQSSVPTETVQSSGETLKSPETPIEVSEAKEEKPVEKPRPKPFIRTRLSEDAENEKDNGIRKGPPLPPLCKPVYDKPWMVHDGETFRRGAPRQRQTVRARVHEQWSPGQQSPKKDEEEK